MEGTHGPTTSLSEDQTQASGAVVVVYSNGEVAMSATEFKQLLDAGNVLESLVYGHTGMHRETKLDVFKRFDVLCEGLNAIRLYVRGNGTLPSDDTSYIANSALREYAITFGGFPLVDAALEKRETEKDENREEHEGKQRDSLHATSPILDRQGADMYEWRQVVNANGNHAKEFQESFNVQWKEGFEWVSFQTVE
uniref:Uncharacterized protein n=1 Tax=Chromera velia CCMP2878 TaxID=1169474 RepID=A0A0G4FH87_9ALVE|eukprot:Cvel_16937.t1-p1 / transcript=Cvel_16937.t1 / gene=Cvel_16937 / organism=Chromera_velia_CCMP2878 / gene_product=hypothetical protein / transcript_product=hypothetical protein / location=Cvel_scaffold1328:8999-9580(+) / protein_length=194 / sequence_SO=supercontig / SO=protein_coding / is_pseudo=false